MVRSGSAGAGSGVDGRVSDPHEAMGESALAALAAVAAAWFAAVLLVTGVTCSISWVLGLVPVGLPGVVRLGLVLVFLTLAASALWWTLLTVPRV